MRGLPSPIAAAVCAPLPAPQPVLDMGRNIRTTVKPSRKKAAAGAGGSGSGGPGQAGGAQRLERPVVNCLR